MALTLAVTDAGNGGGATATISGSSGGSVSVYYAPWNLATGALADWTLEGSRTGNGTLGLTLGSTGYWWLHAVEGSNLSNFVYLRTTSGSESIQFQILEAVQSVVQGLALPGIGSNVVLLKVPVTDDFGENRTYEFPACLVSPARDATEAMFRQGSTNESNDIGYPVSVQFVDGDNRDQEANFNRNLQWRQDVIRTFEHKRLSGVDEVYLGQVDPGIIVSSAQFQRQYWVSGVGLRFFTREPRTV